MTIPGAPSASGYLNVLGLISCRDGFYYHVSGGRITTDPVIAAHQQ